MKKLKNRLLSLIISVLIIISAMPLGVFAAPATNLPKKMFENVFLDALAYTGYDVSGQINDGTIFKVFSNAAPSSVRSDIGYGTSLNGTETISKSGTATGKAPDISKFEASGLCCASYVSYVYFNYMPNIAGIDTSDVVRPTNLRLAEAYDNIANSWVSSGTARKISFTQNGDNFSASEEIPIGSLVTFKNSSGAIKHVAIYAGEYEDKHFITHVGNDNGPEICTIEGMTKGGSPQVVNLIAVPEFINPKGIIEINKKDTDGNALAGATFVATPANNSSKQYLIGPTNSKGYAKSAEYLPYGTYTVKETVFPDNFRAYGKTEWTVTISAANNGVASFSAVNELIPGTLKILKTSEDKKVSGIEFTVSGNGINKKVKTDSDGAITITDLKPGEYTVTETESNKYVPQESKKVTVKSGETVTVNFSNTLRKGNLTVVKSAEDGIVKGLVFQLSGTSDSGENVNLSATTDSSGKAYFKNIPIGTYKLTEKNTPDKYVVPAAINVKIEYNKTVNIDVDNKLRRGNLTVIKNSEDGVLNGMTFNLSGTSLSGKNVNINATTDSDGKAYFKNVLIGTYKLTETNTPDRYIPVSSKEVTVKYNETVTVNIENKLKRGYLTVTKTAEDGLKEGLEFILSGTSLSGAKVNVTAVSDSTGKAYFKNILIGDYTLSEKNTPIKYVVPKTLNVTVNWDKTTNTKIHNVLKKWRAQVIKSDREASTAQGDATLKGAVYGLYDNDKLIDTYTTDDKGRFITDYYVCGNNYYFKEITPSEGYLLDETKYYVDSQAKLYTVEHNTTEVNCFETVKKGNIRIIKHADDGSTQIETPEVGAEFQIFLKSTDSFDKAKESERDYLTIDKYGIAVSKLLPYGIYTVKQTKGDEANALMPSFDVKISEDGELYSYIINNAPFKAFIEIVKKDATTGKQIPVSGVGFKVRNLETGEYIYQHINYPTPIDIDTFYTDQTGKLRLPETLGFGEYEIIEQCTANGYVLDATPVKFSVTGTDDIVVVVKENVPQMGTISLKKEGEVFASVTEKDGIYTPIYEVKGLEDAVFSVYAAEDIYTPDGTLRHTKGDKVVEIITNSEGIAETKPLFLGKYVLQEDTAPFGMVISAEPLNAELIYAGQEIEITSTSVKANNTRQKATISLSKELEKDNIFGIGLADEYKSVKFGLFAAEDIIALDGSMIPKDGILEIISIDEKGNGVFKADIPVGAKLYVKEIATNTQYVLSDTVYPIDFNYAGQDIAVLELTINDGKVIKNDIIRGNIIGHKTDDESSPIKDAVFGLFKSDETEFTEKAALVVTKSDGNGIFKFSNIPYGKWIVKELECPANYVLCEEIFEINIISHNEEISINAVNKRVKGNIKGCKTDDNKSPVKDAVFGLFSPDTTEFTEENALYKSTSDENGYFEFKDILYGKWIIKEISCPIKYVMNNELFNVEINSYGQIIELNVINKQKYGKIEGLKTDSGGNVLKGAVFGLFDDTITEFTKESAYTVTESDAKGIFGFEKVPYGKWIVKELSCPKGYVLSDEIHNIEILEDGEIISLKAVNKIITGSVEGKKTDEKFNPIKGVEFGLFAPDTKEFNKENALKVSVTDKDGKFSFTDVSYGKWVIKELSTPKGYMLSDKAYDISITKDGEVLSLGIVNKRISGVVKVIKLNKNDTSQLLSGAEFELYIDKDHNKAFNPKIDTFVGKLSETDIGIYEFDGLQFGGYFLYESKAPDNFKKDNRYFYFNITEEGKIVIVENEKGVGFVNEPISQPNIPNTPYIPQTGDDSNLTGYIITGLAALLLLIVCNLKLTKKSKQR